MICFDVHYDDDGDWGDDDDDDDDDDDEEDVDDDDDDENYHVHYDDDGDWDDYDDDQFRLSFNGDENVAGENNAQNTDQHLTNGGVLIGSRSSSPCTSTTHASRTCQTPKGDPNDRSMEHSGWQACLCRRRREWT